VTSPSQSRPEQRSFDAVLAELETCVRRLEAGGMSLTDAVTTFEQGVSLQQQCQELLDATERRIEELSAAPTAPSPESPTT
jgi:exodeoxyribonuclease VII small subunit